MKIILEGYYTFPIKGFKFKSKYNLLRIEFEHHWMFSAFLNKFALDADKMRGLGRCFFTGPNWVVEIYTSTINVTLETEEE